MSATTRFLLHSRPVLALAIAALASGPALADVAGRVSYVLGSVSAISLDGTTRKLAKSDLVYSGERLETGRGRLQIRFTDGSFVSLQPDTSFRLDNYSFNKSQPEQGTLQFNFLRGGLRTVTGAIGKVNRANYTVRSPVATIGIRGTGYATTLNNGVLTLTVDKGIVNLSNQFGSSNINAGQTFQVEEGEAPHPAPPQVNANALAQAPDISPDKRKDLLALIDDSLDNNDIRAGELAVLPPPEFSQAPVLDDSFYHPEDNGDPRPAYTFASRFPQAGGSLLVGNVGGFFNHNTDSARGGLLQLTTTANNRVSTLFNAGDVNNGGLHFSNVTTLGALSFGEWTNGSAADAGLAGDGSIALGVNEFEPYIIGLASTLALGMDTQGNAISLSYSLVGGTPARSTNGETGALSKLNLNITLSPVMMVDISMAVDMAQTGRYSLDQTGIAIHNPGNSNTGFQLENTELHASGQHCASGGCPVTLGAFFAGENDLGAIYSLDRVDGSQIGGVGALTRTEATPTPVKLANTDSPVYSAVFVDNASLSLHQENSISANFDNNGGLQMAVVGSGNAYGPEGQNAPATITGGGHAAQTLAWGRWVNGDITSGDGTLTLNSDGMHYLVGTPTVSNFPTTKLSYNLVGGTNPTAAVNGALVSTGNLQSGVVSIDFGQQTASLQLGLGFGSGNNTTGVNLNGAGSISTGKLAFDNLAVKVSTNGGNAVSCTNCNASASGFVAGTNADLVGLGYQVQGATVVQNGNTSISGVGVFANKH